MFKLAPTLNNINANKLVKTNFREKLQKLTEEYLDNFFSSLNHTSMMCDSEQEKNHQIISEKGTKSLKTIVHCKSVREVYEKMLSKRNIHLNHITKMGINGGGGFLKVSLGIMSSGTSESKTSTSSKNLLMTMSNFDGSCACK